MNPLWLIPLGAAVHGTHRGRAAWEPALQRLQQFLQLPEAARHADLARRYPEQFAAFRKGSRLPMTQLLAAFYADFSEEVRYAEDNEEAPSYLFMEYRQRLPHTTWLVHYTDEKATRQIVCHGFRRGAPDLATLGVTIALRGKESGYNFGFRADDIYEGALSGKSLYGDSIVMFQAPGLLVWHEGDEQNQVVFWGADARNIVQVNRTSGYATTPEGQRYFRTDFCVGRARNGRPLFCGDGLDAVASWLDVNYATYRKRLTHC